MKTIFLFLCGVFAVADVFAQGYVNFAARVEGVYDAPVTSSAGDKLAGSDYLVQLYAGASEFSLQPIGAALPFGVGLDGGYWTAVTREIPAAAIAANGISQIQVRAWTVAAGSTWEQVLCARGGYGYSNVIPITPSIDAEAPTTLFELQSFSVSGLPLGNGDGNVGDCPEPSTIIFISLGCLSLLATRRS